MLVHTIFISCSPQVIGIILQVGSLVDLQIANQTTNVYCQVCRPSGHQHLVSKVALPGHGWEWFTIACYRDCIIYNLII